MISCHCILGKFQPVDRPWRLPLSQAQEEEKANQENEDDQDKEGEGEDGKKSKASSKRSYQCTSERLSALEVSEEHFCDQDSLCVCRKRVKLDKDSIAQYLVSPEGVGKLYK